MVDAEDGDVAAAAADLGKLTALLTPGIQYTLGKRSSWVRYWILWERAWVVALKPHSHWRERVARSIKRRRTKRLVSRAQYRFWP